MRSLAERVYIEFSRRQYSRLQCTNPNKPSKWKVEQILKNWRNASQQLKDSIARDLPQVQPESQELIQEAMISNRKRLEAAQKDAKASNSYTIRPVQSPQQKPRVMSRYDFDGIYQSPSPFQQPSQPQIPLNSAQIIALHEDQALNFMPKKEKKIKRKTLTTWQKRRYTANRLYYARKFMRPHQLMKSKASSLAITPFWNTVKFSLKSRFEVQKTIKDKMKHRRADQRRNVVKTLHKKAYLQKIHGFEPPALQLTLHCLKKQSYSFQGQIGYETPEKSCAQCSEIIKVKGCSKCKNCQVLFHLDCAKVARASRTCPGCNFKCQDISTLQEANPLKSAKRTRMTVNWLTPSPPADQAAKKTFEEACRFITENLRCSYTFLQCWPANRFQSLLQLSKMPQFQCVTSSDYKAFHQMNEQKTLPPIRIGRCDYIQGYGAFASRKILAHELITTYAGNVLPLAHLNTHLKKQDEFKKDYVMSILEGNSPMNSWASVPYTVSSLGVFVNCCSGQKKPNVQTLTVFVHNQLTILMRAMRTITEGEQLLYDYNGRLDEYDTSNFK